ncbi:MAG: TIGR04283 family arsenosugar biosynthesis glycosyltransferase [Mariprofundaceae bacterium]|nr:TIGR04283 family arsenosugar biosynthesis glycosyltransferase [Mariprofundaceae bacterium]
MKDLTVIVPVFNEAISLAQNMAQLKALLKHCSIMFCDGESDDETCFLLKQSGLLYCCSLRGRALQMNAGAKLCQSDILLFMHADTVINGSHIQAVKEAMQDRAIVGGRFDVHLSGKRKAFRVIEYMINLRSRLTGVSTGDQCQFVRRSVFEAMGGFSDQPLMEDVAFSKQLKRYGKVTCLRHKVSTSSRRWEKYGIVKTVILMWKLRFLYWLGMSPERLARMYRNVR